MRRALFLLLPAGLVVALYVAVSASGGGPGFPLDDSWIHQTYARNLAQTGQWSFRPGETSSGSTAPLWTLLLAVGYLLHLPYHWWSYALGALCLAWLAWTGMALWRMLWPQAAAQSWLAGLALLLTWPLVWAAASGMETLLFIALGLTIVWLYLLDRPHLSFPLGLLSGLLVLARPDGLLLVLLVTAGLAFRPGRARALPLFLFAAALPLLPYFAFNVAAGGELWPNTFYAKQAEYAGLHDRFILRRFLSLLYLSLGGPAVGLRGITAAHLLLLPGLLLAAWVALRLDWRQRQLAHTLPLLWAAGHVFLFAWRLPVTYQHGRYLWAAIPVWLLFGLAGWQMILVRLPVRRRTGRILRRTAALTFALTLLIFLLLGAQAYATDVAFIEGEMVRVAQWLQQNTGPDALIAAHDIGAIGYFAQRPLLDLAGLVSPDVIPYLADETALAAYVANQQADYLVTAPGWPYPEITGRPNVRLLFTTDYAWTRKQGLNNMAVYALP